MYKLVILLALMKRLGVVGLGYVGLPLALLASQKGFNVVGVDTNKEKIDKLLSKKSPFNDKHIGQELGKTQCTFTTDFSLLSKCKYFFVCVPTPVKENKEPDLSLLEDALKEIAPYITHNSEVIVESTINPGVCDELVIPELEKMTSLKVNGDFGVSHCPERINPGDEKWNLSNIPRVIGSSNPKSIEKVTAIYKKIIESDITKMSSLKEAEAVKIIENSFRDINIAFVNELSKSFHKMSINLDNVIKGASTKPFAFMPHYPGCGVGGHCIPVDPYYLIQRGSQFGFDHNFLKLAREINESMPSYTVDLLKEAANEVNIDLKDSSVLILGQSYKADVSDMRESPAVHLFSLLQQENLKVHRFEPFDKRYSDFSSLEQALRACKLVIVATGHDDFRKLSSKDFVEYGTKIIVDGRGIFGSIYKDIQSSGIVYRGIGIN